MGCTGIRRHAFTVAITFEMTAQVVKVTVSSMSNMSFFFVAPFLRR